MTVVMFTKMLKRTGERTLDAAATDLVDLGFDGADLTVRPGGYVEPADAPDELPAAIERLESHGLDVPMLTTAITGTDDPAAREIFEIADSYDVEALKLGYWTYDGFGNLRRQLDELREDLDALAELSAEFAVTPTLHIHSGDFLTAEATLVWELLEDYDPELLGAYLDPGHMTLEGGISGWEIGMDALQEHARIVSVKNFGWVETETPDGDVAWEPTKYPLADGITPWPSVIDHLQSIGYDGIYTVHSEYYDMDYTELYDQTAADLAYLRSILED